MCGHNATLSTCGPCLLQVCTYLTSKSWETRIAAGQAVEAIVKNVKPWQPTYQPRAESEDSRESTPATDASSAELLSFDSFDIQRVRLAMNCDLSGCRVEFVHNMSFEL